MLSLVVANTDPSDSDSKLKNNNKFPKPNFEPLPS
jgi:hypothetical protein